MSWIEIEKKVQSFVVGIECMHNLETYMGFWQFGLVVDI